MTETVQATSDEMKSLARTRLAQVLETGIQKASRTIERVMAEVPEDRVAAASSLGFEIKPWNLVVGGHEMELHRHAFAQLCQRAGVPTDYMKKLTEDTSDDWQHELAKHTLATHYQNDSGRYLVRSVGEQVRGFLSDRYRRLDSRPLLDAFVTAAKGVCAVPFEGVSSDTRHSLRVVLPEMRQITENEHVVFGLDWRNSDFGNGSYSVSSFVLRLVCLNGMVGASGIKSVHVGSRLAEDICYSDRTYQLDTQRNISATIDVVNELLSPERVEKRVEAMRATYERETTWGAQQRGLRGTLTKAEQKAVKEAFEGPEVVMLPPQKTVARFANALSWVANQVENPERKVELQQHAGKLMEAA